MNRIAIVLLLLIPFALISACGSAAPPFPVAETSAKSSPAGPSTDDLVVYLDTSASMAGYVSPPGAKAISTISPDGKTVFSKTLLDIRDVVMTMAPQPKVWLRTVDSNVSDPFDGNLKLSESASNQARFAGSNTDLVTAIKAFSKPLEKSSANPPARYHLMITDGVQSTGLTDPFLIRKELTTLMNAGWGGAILGLRSEFKGKVFKELKGGWVDYDSGKAPDKFRPFYIYVFSPDRTGIDTLVTAMCERFSKFANADILKVYPLTAPYSQGPSKVTNPGAEKAGGVNVDTESSVDNSSASGIVVRAEPDLAMGREQFTLNVKPEWSVHAKAVGLDSELASTLKWEMNLVPPSMGSEQKQYPEFKKLKETAEEDGSTTLTFEVGWPVSAIEKAWSTYRVVGKVGKLPSWVMSWNTPEDNAVEDANKTLNIAAALENLWQNTAQNERPVVEMYVLVGPS